jgi:predicted ATP-dependent endonuclease of OLD family
VTRFVLSEMRQSIVTSHSPYVIEQFEPQQVVILNRDSEGVLSGHPIDAQIPTEAREWLGRSHTLPAAKRPITLEVSRVGPCP